jgi:hypothetical protein
MGLGRYTTILKKTTRDFYRFIFPGEMEKPEFVMQVLKEVYKGVEIDWERIRFFYGLPWIMALAGNEASTQPGTYDFDQIHIYFAKKKWAPYTTNGLSTIVHEVFHALQYQQTAGGYGPGYFRPMLIPYFSGYCTCGRGREHDVECEAYNFEDRFKACLQAAQQRAGLSEPETYIYDKRNEIFAELIPFCNDLAPVNYRFPFWKYVVSLTPGIKMLRRISERKKTAMILWPWILVWNTVVCAAGLAFAILKPLFEIVFLTIYSLMRGVKELAVLLIKHRPRRLREPFAFMKSKSRKTSG